jgi:hypothetical protein
MASTKRWGSLFTYVGYDPLLDEDDGVTMRFHDVVLLKDFGGGTRGRTWREGTRFDQAEIDVSVGKVSFGIIVDCPSNECGKDIEFTEAFQI